METILLVPDSSALRVEQVSVASEEAVVFVSSARPVGYCPKCGRPAARVHSRYQRSLQDLSWQGTQVTIRWQTRKFFCDMPDCPQRIFTEQLPTVTWRYGRRTIRARQALEFLGLALGGEGGCRVAHRLHLPVSGDTVLRGLRRMDTPEFPRPRVIGVDDWALCRGQRYGTVIVDLERHRPLDLLPDRKYETFRDWLTAHPGVEVVSRDRADYYAHGAADGAPQAIQVADRWHLFTNVREALQHSAERFTTEIQRAAQTVAAATPDCENRPVSEPVEALEPLPLSDDKRVSTAEMHHSLRRQRYERVKQLHAQGISGREIARTLGLDRKTVHRMLNAPQFPERAARRPSGRLAPFLNDLRRLWNGGCHNAQRLSEELQRLNYRGSYYSVRRAVQGWRRSENAGVPAVDQQRCQRAPIVHVPSARHVAWLLFLDPQELEMSEQAMAQAISNECPLLGAAGVLAREFTMILKHRRAGDLPDWIERASSTGLPIEFRRFAHGLLTDLAAIQAAATMPWSNGQTEGQVNRLKLTKRQMYGRANLDLLRMRFLMRSGMG